MKPDEAESLSLPRIRMWRRWEQNFTAKLAYDNPYLDVTVEVTFFKTEEAPIRTLAYWDGGRSFKATVAFPSAGLWTYSTLCSRAGDTGLHLQSGQILVEAAASEEHNALYRNGMLRISKNGGYIEHADGTPFFWLGDTVWPVFYRATADEWLAYVKDRARKGFTVVQACLSWGGGRTADTDGRETKLEGDECWNPLFYQGVQDKIRVANDHGLVVLLNGLYCPEGRMTEGNRTLRFDRYEHYGKMLAARFNGSFVVYSPSFDVPYDPAYDRQAAAIRSVTDRHLITQHPNTCPAGTQVPQTSATYHDRDYLDFTMCQSGHHNGDTDLIRREAAEWIDGLVRLHPRKPVVNGEAFYDAGGMTPNLHPKYRGTDRDARAAGYLSLLSGACGYTYGAYGLWNWEIDPDVPHRTAMQFASAGQMSVLARLFRQVRWWELAPASERIADNPDSWQRRMALALAKDGALGLAYMPNQAEIVIALDTLTKEAPYTASFINPLNGERIPASSIQAEGTRLRIEAPDRGEWMLILERT